MFIITTLRRSQLVFPRDEKSLPSEGRGLSRSAHAAFDPIQYPRQRLVVAETPTQLFHVDRGLPATFSGGGCMRRVVLGEIGDGPEVFRITAVCAQVGGLGPRE